MAKKSQKKSQSLSADVVIVVIIILFGGLFLVVSKLGDAEEKEANKVYEEAAIDSNVIFDNLKDSEVVDSQNNVDIERILAMDHDELKAELNLKNDFAIVFEKDGKLVKIDPENNVNCVGSSKIVVNGEPCR